MFESNAIDNVGVRRQTDLDTVRYGRFAVSTPNLVRLGVSQGG
jgi:hypothetical protein